MVSVHDSGSSGPGSSPGRGHCVVFSGRTLQSSFYAFCGGGLSLVCYGGVSVQRESTVHLKYNLHLLFY